MKTQEQLNDQYDKIIHDFRQKFTIEFMLKYEKYSLGENENNAIENAVDSFSSNFNEKNGHLFLKPLMDSNIFDKKTDIADALEKCFESCPSTYWQTPEGKELINIKARKLIHDIYNTLINNYQTEYEIKSIFSGKVNKLSELFFNNDLLDEYQQRTIFKYFIGEGRYVFGNEYFNMVPTQQQNSISRAKEVYKKTLYSNIILNKSLDKFKDIVDASSMDLKQSIENDSKNTENKIVYMKP